MRKIGTFLLLFLLVTQGVISQQIPSVAPQNPDFISFLDRLKSGEYPMPGTEEFGTGAVPPPVKVNFDHFQKNNSRAANDLPAYYDLRQLGLVTPVRSQTSNGCWAFASIASVESRWLKLGVANPDLSENNLKYCHGFDPDRSYWGNHYMSTAYFARRSGPLTESDDPNSGGTPGPGLNCPTGKIPLAYLTEARYLPDDMNTVKQAVIDYGAIYTMMYISGTYYNPVNYTYYYNGSPNINHAVAIVGWDDAKVTAAALPGAWICKNSYGSSWGEGGYFYLSYYDSNNLDYNAYWPAREEFVAEDFLYGYDELGNYGAYGYGIELGYMLVKYVASDYHMLTKVGTYALGSNEAIEIDVFDDFNPTTKALSGQVSHTDGILCPMPGYYTNNLSVPVSVSPGDDFYIRVRYSSPGVEYQLPVEYEITDYSYPVVESNVAWLSSNGANGSWYLIGGTNTDFKGDPCVKVYAEPWNSWTGTVNSDWNTAGNWSKGEVPDMLDDIEINDAINDPAISNDPETPASCHHLIIHAGASLGINAGKALTVTGTLANEAGVSGLVLHAGSSLIANTSSTATVESAITDSRWHLISAPVAAATANVFLGHYLQTHSEPTNRYTDIISAGTNLTPANGFALWGDAAGFTGTYTGNLNNGAITISLSRTAAGINSGWNLVGNPYPSVIDWDALSGWTKTNLNNAIYIENNGGWATYISGAGANGGSAFVAPGQGFFVSANALGPASLGFSNDVRVHKTTSFLKSLNTIPQVKLQVSGNGYTDEAVVRFMPEASIGFDPEYDAMKLFGYIPESAQLYSMGSEELTINSLPDGSDEVQLGVKTAVAGNYILTLMEANNIENLILEDLKTGTYASVANKPYAFTVAEGDNELRFKLHFNPLGNNETPMEENILISTRQRQILFTFTENTTADIYVYNMAGQLIANELAANGNSTMEMPTAGIYIAKAVSHNGITIKKVIIR